MLIVKSLSKSYGENSVLTNINLTIQPGEIVVVIGPSGSGKSTLLRTLALLDPPDTGLIEIDGEQYVFPSEGSGLPFAPPWPNLTLVFQQLFLWPHLTVLENMELPLRHLNASVRDSRIDELMNQYLIYDFAHRYPNEISIGQRQRVAIARAVSLNPTYLLMDEITSALDVENVEEVLKHLRELARTGKAILLVTHMIGFAKRAATQMLYLVDGRIVEQGHPNRLVAPQTEQLAKFLSLIESGNKGYVAAKESKNSFEAEAVVRHLRKLLASSNEILKDDEATYLDKLPLIDKFRELIIESDIPWLTKLVRSSSDKIAGLACSLLKKFATRKDVLLLFEQMWLNASPYIKNRLMWRLMAIQEKADKWHDKFFEFIFTEWSTFRDFNLSFYSDDPLNTIMKRLLMEPAYKKWLYLCCVPEIVDDSDVAKATIELGNTMNLPHMRDAAKKLLAQFWPRKDMVGPRRADKPAYKESAGFAARAVLAALRSGRRPDEEDSDQLNRRPFIDELLKYVERSDLDQWVTLGASENRVEYAGLCLRLLQKYDNDPEIVNFLKERWLVAPSCIKAHLLWRILDDPSLTQEWHERIFTFILEFPHDFHSVSLKFLGTPKTIVERARERYFDLRFPESKKWSYLCRVAGVAAHPEEAKAFISQALDDNDSFRRHVAQVLLKRYYL